MSTPITIALIGNPNSGKTTLFNDLTGLTQKVGNWAGVTVDRKTGHFSYLDHQCSPICTTLGTNMATSALIKLLSDFPVIIAF